MVITFASRLMPSFTGAGSAGRRRPGRCSNAVLVDTHLLEDGTGFPILLGNLRQVFVQMLAHLVFGGGDEAQADPVADQPGGGTDAEGQAVEDRIEDAGTAAQLADALLAPGQVVDLLPAASPSPRGPGQLGGQRLALVQRLGADLAGVVDAHQAGDMAGVFLAQFAIGFHDGRRRSRRLAAERQQGAQGESACSRKRSMGE